MQRLQSSGSLQLHQCLSQRSTRTTLPAPPLPYTTTTPLYEGPDEIGAFPV
jgi:hypothetical protein